MFKPTGETLYVEAMQKEDMTKSGIILPPTTTKDQQTGVGVVLAVGNGTIMDNGQRISPEYVVGQKIIYAKEAATKIEDNKYVIKESHVLATLED